VTDFETRPCGSCGALIVWASTAHDKAMPVDAEPNPAGNVLLHARPGRGPLAEVVPPGQLLMGGGQLRTSHFATCPHADQHRRPR